MILFLTNADTELLALRVAAESMPEGFPAVRGANPDHLPGVPSIEGVRVVLVRLLGGRQAWREPFDDLRARCMAHGVALLAFGGESVPDAELTELSSVASATVTEAFAYLVHGGVANMTQMLRFVADAVLLEGFGFDPPAPVPTTTWYHPPLSAVRPSRTGDHQGPASSGLRDMGGTGGTGDTAGTSDTSAVSDTSAISAISDISRISDTTDIRDTTDTSAVSDMALRDPGSTVPTVGIVFYRAHLLAGNTQFVDDLAAAVQAKGGRAVAVATYSLRPDEHGVVPAVALLAEAQVDVVVTTTLAAGSLDEAAGSWDAGALGSLGVPVVQGVCATTPCTQWAASPAGLGPTDVAMSVAVVEFDGRIVSVPFSFKEVVDDDDILGSPLSAYRTVRDRTEAVAGLAVRLGRLRHRPPAQKRVALVLSAYPTKRSRLGNAVGLDTPASVIELLHAMRRAGYRVERIPPDGDALMAELADGLTYDTGELEASSLPRALGTMDAMAYVAWFDELPEDLAGQVTAAWGPAPGTVGVSGGTLGVGSGTVEVSGGTVGVGSGTVEVASGTVRVGGGTVGVSGGGDARLVFSGIDLGGVVVAVQPPRGFGENPVAVYHSPDLPPTHHYLAFYRWLDSVWGADAIVHVGKHGTLEWLPGKGVGPSASCAADAALGEVPLVYPFVVNDPGEGTQAKRRAHAVIVDHLVPPLTRADTYDDLARLEQLLDEHARVVSLDPAKLPALRRQVWDCLVAAEIHRDMGLAGAEAPAFEDPAFDDLLVEVDGYLCELKDAQIRGGLHVLGKAPRDDAELDLVLAITRLGQGSLPSLREVVAQALGVDLAGGARRDVDAVEAECRRLLASCQAAGWRMPAAPQHPPGQGTGDSGSWGGASASPAAARVAEVLRWVCERLAPALAGTAGEIEAVLGALDGRFVAPGPSGAPSRGHAHVLPTGRNFYAVDPRAIPSRLAWQVGVALADRLVERHVAEEGRVPRHVALVVWGTAAMRTAGDDVAEALALLGVRPVWEEESGRVTGLEVIPLAELGRPRVDVTLRVSGFFRDAFPHVVSLVDEAMSLVSAREEAPEENPLAGHGDEARIFGPKPGAYGSGILALLENRNWRSDDDLAAVYVAWGGWSYRRGAMGAPAADALRLRLAGVEVAVKNQDNREHDIFDSDDYLQDHGGMVAAIRSITGREPKAWFGDSADPARPVVRSLAEEAARVVRSRVVNPKWIDAMMRHGYKGAFEMAATVDYLFGYDATAHVAENWMYEKVTDAYVGDPEVQKFLQQSNPWALRSISERLLEAAERGLWEASDTALRTLRAALLEAEGWEEDR